MGRPMEWHYPGLLDFNPDHVSGFFIRVIHIEKTTSVEVARRTLACVGDPGISRTLVLIGSGLWLMPPGRIQTAFSL